MKLRDHQLLEHFETVAGDPLAVRRLVEAGRSTDGSETEAEARLDARSDDFVGPVEMWCADVVGGDHRYDLWLYWAHVGVAQGRAAHPSSPYGAVFPVGSADPVVYVANRDLYLCGPAPSRARFEAAIAEAAALFPETMLGRVEFSFWPEESTDVEVFIDGQPCPSCGAERATFRDAYRAVTCLRCGSVVG
jgi:hypothetical protein